MPFVSLFLVETLFLTSLWEKDFFFFPDALPQRNVPKISSFLPPVPITLFHSFLFGKKTQTKPKKAGKTQKDSGILSPRHSAKLSRAACTYCAPGFLRARARVSRLPRAAFQRPASRCRDNGISGWNASIRRGSAGRGARYRLLEGKPTQTYALAAGRHGWLAIWFDLRDIKKREGRKGEEGSTHARTRIRLILPPHWNTVPLCTL